jgi:formyltetrahydrofolate deformylase
MEFSCPTGDREKLTASFRAEAAQWRLAEWCIQVVGTPELPDLAKPRVMVLVSKAGHCLSELLALQANGALPGHIVAVAGNHTDLQDDVERAGVPFTHIPWPTAAADGAGHNAAHARLQQLVMANNVDLLVLARFMQVVRADVCDFVPTINVHHVRSALSCCRALRLLVVALLVLGRHGVQVEVSR